MKKTQKRNDRVDPSRIKADGWVNILTGLGLKGKDKRLESQAEWERLAESDCEQLYAGDDIAGKVVDLLPEDALREGWTLKGIEDAEAEKLNAEFYDRLGLAKSIEIGWKYARIYGGGGLLIMADDTQDYATPLNPARVKQIKSILPFTRFELVGGDLDSDLTSPNFGKPKFYSLSPRGGATSGQGGMRFHHTRVIRLEGKLLPPRLFAQNNYWHDSALNTLQNSLLNFNTAHDSAALALQDFRVAVFKIKNLMSLISNGQDDLVKTRLEIVNLSKSIAKAVVVDADGESFEHSTTQFAGIPEVLGKMTSRLQASTNIPHTKLFNTSPSGLGATGNSEERNWYDYVSSQQESYLQPTLFTLYKLIAAQATVRVILPKEFEIEFNPLWQMDDKELTEIRSKQSATDQIYLENGVLDSNEVRESRFGSGKWAADTTLKPVPVVTTPDPTATGQGGVDVAKQALNGAQVGAVLEAVQNVVLGLLPRDSAVNIILKAFPFLSSAEAEAMIGSAGKGFTPPPNAAQLASQQRQDAAELVVPEGVKGKAAAGLVMRQNWGRGGTSISAKRAKDLADGKPPSRTTLTRMAAYKKHADLCDQTKKMDDGGPTAEQIAVMLWGGKEGIEWAQSKLDELNGRK